MHPAFEKMMRRDYEGALALCEQSLASDPRSLESASLKLNLLWIHLRRPSEALAAADYVLSLVPPTDELHRETLVSRASILIQMGRIDDAIACGMWLLHYAPHDPESYERLASIYAMAKRERDAVATYDHGIHIFPRATDLYEKRGLYLMAAGHYIPAGQTFDAALAFAPGESGLWYNRGCALARLGDVENAVASLARSLAIRPEGRENAQSDGDYAVIRDDPRFRALIGLA